MRRFVLPLVSLLSAGAAEVRAAAPALTLAADAIQPHLSADREGNLYAVFIHEGNISAAASRDRGATFGKPVVAIDAGGRARGGLQRGPRIGADAGGKVITVTAPVFFDATEFEKRYPTSDLYAVRSIDGGKTWSKPIRFNEEPKKAPEALHWLAVDSSGDAHVAWLDLRDREQGQDIFYARISNGSVGKNRKVAGEVCECCAPALAVDAAGRIIIAYREGGTKPSREIYAVHSAQSGGAFGKPARINPSQSRVGG